MNTNTGHLVKEAMLAGMTDEERKQYEEVPKELNIEARLELMGKMETVVGKESTGSINTWAEEKRVAKQMTTRQKNKFSLP